LFFELAADDCLVLCDDRVQFLDLKANMEAIFEVTLQEGAILRFLNLRIIQILAGISIDQTDHIVETTITPYLKNQCTSELVSITSPFPTDSSFEQRLFKSPVLVGASLEKIEDQHGGSLYHWNGVLLHVTVTTRVDINYAIMRIAGYLLPPNDVIFEGLSHTTRHLFFFRHIPIVCLRCPLNKKSLAFHWGKGTAEFLLPEFGNVLVNTADADYPRDIRDRPSVTPHIHLINVVIVACKFKKKSITTLHSMGSEIYVTQIRCQENKSHP
jgi:hypothetical protein